MLKQLKAEVKNCVELHALAIYPNDLSSKPAIDRYLAWQSTANPQPPYDVTALILVSSG